MKSQKMIFKFSEADAWFNRNKVTYSSTANDESQIVEVIREIELMPERVLEIGCSNGFQLQFIEREFGCKCYGIDPSPDAIQDGIKTYPNLHLKTGTADNLPFEDGFFDTIIFGFCLYLCDREDLFKIAYEADRCLQNKGSIIIKDFFPPFPYKNSYSHYDGVFSYKMNYGRMFTWNPAYTELVNVVFSHEGYNLRDIPDERISIIILRKNNEFAYPLMPFSNGFLQN